MWRHPDVQKFSGPAQDQHGESIELPAKSPAESDRLISFWLDAAKKGWGFRWAIIARVPNDFVGHIGFNSLTQCSEIAYHLNPAFWGQGLMTEAAVAAIKWRQDDGAKEIEAFIEPGNTGSIALAHRLGMQATDTYSEGARRYRLSLTKL